MTGAASAIDHGYTTLLTHLSRTSTPLQLNSLQSSIAYYLAHQKPPTTLAASVLASPRFRTFGHEHLEALVNAFRQAALLRHKLLKDEGSGLLSPSLNSRLNAWVAHIREGLKDGRAVLRLVCSGGLLLGIDDITNAKRSTSIKEKSNLEDDVVLALAETMDLHMKANASATGTWEKEFASTEKDALHMVPPVASSFLELLPSRKLKAIPLDILASIMDDVVISTFSTTRGTFLYTSKESITISNGLLHIPQSSPLATYVSSVVSSHSFGSIAAISRFHARILSVLNDDNPAVAKTVLARALRELEDLAAQVEVEWEASLLPDYQDENRMSEPTKATTQHIWRIFKTLLFTTILLTQSILTSLVYTPPSRTLKLPSRSSHSSSLSASSAPDLALLALQTFSHLSFIIVQFGGISSSSGTGFAELKRAAYTALDILATDPVASARFTTGLLNAFVDKGRDGKDREKSQEREGLARAKLAFSLACVEQLVPVLPPESVRSEVIPLCVRYADDPTHRETYESAHSVLLAVFSAAASNAYGGQSPLAPVAKELVPWYTECLIRNSEEGRLTDAQLRLAYASLVRGASSTSSLSSSALDADALAWLSVSALLTALYKLPTRSPRAKKLRLALVSCIPALSLSLLPRALDSVLETLKSTEKEERDELAKALFEECLQSVGDVEKQFVLEWWDRHGRELTGSDEAVAIPAAEAAEANETG